MSRGMHDPVHDEQRLAAEAARAFGPSRSVRALLWRRFLEHRLAVVSLMLIAALCIVTLAAPLAEALLGVDGEAVDLFSTKMPPSGAHPLGTDELGRDLLVRLLYGGRISLLTGIAAALCAAVIGSIVGLLAGYHGGKLDAVLGLGR